jgi:hypothetical protein
MFTLATVSRGCALGRGLYCAANSHLASLPYAPRTQQQQQQQRSYSLSASTNSSSTTPATLSSYQSPSTTPFTTTVSTTNNKTAFASRPTRAYVTLPTVQQAYPRIMITGALGQIGTELGARLRQIYGRDNVLATDVRKPFGQLSNEGPFVYADVSRYRTLERLVVEHRIDWVVGWKLCRGGGGLVFSFFFVCSGCWGLILLSLSRTCDAAIFCCCLL